MIKYGADLKPLARTLRSRMTDAERRLWWRIRGKQVGGLQFYRQKPLGRFVVDFYCPKANLVIELDGGQHLTTVGREKDAHRDAFLAGEGARVLRFSDRDVFENLEGILDRIEGCLSENPPRPPFEKGGNTADRMVALGETRKSPLPPFGKGGKP